MDYNGLDLNRNDHSGQKIKLSHGLKGQTWIKMNRMDQNGSEWTKMDQNGPEWTKMDYNRQNLDKEGF